MRILVLGTNYFPEKTAVGPFTTGLCEQLAREGNHVTIVTAFPYYPEWRIWDAYRGRMFQKESINGVTVHRVWHYVPRQGSSLLQRLLHDFSFTLSALLAGLFAGGCDVIYCACPPPTLAFTAYLLGKIHRKPYVIKLTDLASDAALATGILKDGLALRVARAIEGFVFRKSDRVVCLCQAFIERLSARGLAREKLELISDWADTQRVYPIARATSFRSANEFSTSQFLVMHTGNMGKKQDLLNVVRAAGLSQGSPELLWVLVGNGEDRAMLEHEIRRRALGNIRLLPLQPVETLAEMYSAADVLLLNQKAAIEDAVIPSKLLTYMAAGRPIVAAVSEKSEAARQIRSARSGLRVPSEDPQALLGAVLQLRWNAALRRSLGANGRAYAERHFTRQRVLQQYSLLFSRYVVGTGLQPEVSKRAAVAP